MISKYVKELKKYTYDELRRILEPKDNKDLNRIINRLKEYGILKTVKKSDKTIDISELSEEEVLCFDEENENDHKYYYIFKFVGIIIFEGRAIKCYPKYLADNLKPEKELKQIIKVLRKYNAKEQNIYIFNNEGENKSKFNRLAAIVFLLSDFYEYGVYTTDELIFEKNGFGEIQWDKTVAEFYPVFKEGTPIYLDVISRRTRMDELDYIKRLHECVLTTCSRELQEAGLLDVFDFFEVELSDENIEDFGEKEYLLYRICAEKNIQFNTRKQLILDVLEHIVKDEAYLEEKSDISVFGTPSFNLVWEGICKEVFKNQLKSKRGDIEKDFFPDMVTLSLEEKEETLDKVIEKPLWKRKSNDGRYQKAFADSTLIPDMVCFEKDSDNDVKLYILDAKYYVPEFNEDKIEAQPGIESIVKQYMYLFAFMKFITEHKISMGNVYNCFILPKCEDEMQYEDEVELSIIHNMVEGISKVNNSIRTESMKIPRIQARYIDPEILYESYLINKDMRMSELHL